MAANATTTSQKWERMKEAAKANSPTDQDLLIYALTREEERRAAEALIPNQEATYPETDKTVAAMQPISGDLQESRGRMVLELTLISEMMTKKAGNKPQMARTKDDDP